MHVPHKHGCFTAWLALIIVGATFGLIALLLAQQVAHGPRYHPPSPLIVTLIVVCLVASMVCAGFLFLLKRWAFYGYILSNVLLSGINFVAGIDAGRAVVPLVWVACLIGVMQIGGRIKAWNRLR